MLLFSTPHRWSRGQSRTPILVFLGIVGLSLFFFFVLTWPARRERQHPTVHPAAEAPTGTAPASTAMESAPTETAPASTTEPTLPAPVIPARFPSPHAFAQTIAALLARGDLATAVSLLGDRALPADKAAFLESLFEGGRLKVTTPPALREIGEIGPWSRWAIALEPGHSPPLAEASSLVPGTPGAALALELDIGRDAETGWKAEAVHFTEALRHRATAWAPPPPGADPPVTADPLAVTEHFLQAVLRQDYDVARAVTDESQVTREKVAGLCILFEEGNYHLAEQRPLSATVTGEDHAWVIVKVTPGREAVLPGPAETDFGLELRRNAAGAWRVTGLNFSNLLSAYMQTVGATEGVAYAPIVRNPAGGESIVVYFDFDDTGLVPRAKRQLDIVAQLLRGDAGRTLRLTGHADAVGSDDYNRHLSAARAFAVREYLISLGVPARQIVTEGLGTLRPLAANTRPDGSDNPEGRSRNRRTEIFLDF